MENLIPGIIVAFRESLEAFLILILILKFIQKSKHEKLTHSVFYGLISSVIFVVILGFSLSLLGTEIKGLENFSMLWESLASLIAVGLIATFIVWMIQHGSTIKEYVEEKTAIKMTKMGVFVVSFIMVAREGVEIAIFSFAGAYQPLAIIIGVALAVILSVAFYFSLIKISIPLIFKITLVYLIFQAGYLLGIGIHEGLEALESLGVVAESSFWMAKAFNLSSSIFDSKTGLIGIPLNILFGWYSKPEWIPLFTQYLLSLSLFAYWLKKNTEIAKH